MNHPVSTRLLAVALLGAFAVGFGVPVAAAPKPKKKGFAQKHPNLTGAVAGVAAGKIAKRTGRKRAAAGRKRNVLQRHPVATGIVAGAAARHAAKKKR